MRRSVKKEQIDVWRLDDIEGIEFRSGIAVKEPYPKHWHEEYQLCFIQDGGGELTYRGNIHNTPKISLFIVHPGEVHSNSTDIGCSFRSIYVQPEVIQNTLSGSNNSKETFPFFSNPMIFDKEIIGDYLNLHLSLENSETTLERETAMLEMLTKLVNRYAQGKRNVESFGKENNAVKKVQDYIVEHYDQNISLKTLSKLVNLSRFHLNRVFSEEIGMPPHAFQTQVRIAKAKQLIKKGISLSNIATTTGFADQSHFNRHFKRLMKITPSEY
jgi:AraC-like DNA-binding protein